MKNPAKGSESDLSVSGYERINSNSLYEHIYLITCDFLPISAVKLLFCSSVSSHHSLFITFERTMQTVVLEIMQTNFREMKLYQS